MLQKEWLCLNCQTQRAMSGQLGDQPPPAMASPKKEPPAPAPAPAPSPTPAPAAVDSKPVVEAADPTPPSAPETKVEPETIPTPDSELIPPHHDAPLSVSTPPPDSTPHETPQSEEQKQPLSAEPLSEPVIHPEQQAPISESVAESVPAIPAAEQQQSSSEKIAEDHPHPEIEPSDAHQQSASVSEIPVVEQQQSSSEKAAEDRPHSETENNVEQQAQSAPVSGTPAGQQQGSSEEEKEDLPPPVETVTQNLLTNTGLDKTTVPAEAETEPNPKITQSEAAAPLTDNEKVEPTPEKLPEVTNSVEPKPASIPEAVTQEVSVQLDPEPDDSSAIDAKEEKIAEGDVAQPSEKPQIDGANAAGQTPLDTADTALNVEQTDVTTKVEADSVAPDVKNEATTDIKVEEVPLIEKPVSREDAPPPPAPENVAPVDTEVPKPDETQQELKPEPEKCVESESPSVVSENKHPVSAAEEESKANKVENEPIEKDEPIPIEPADKSPPVAPVEGETKAPEEAKEENKVNEKVVIEGETAKPDEETSVEMKTAAEEKHTEEKALETVEERAIEKAEIEKKAFEEEGVQKNAAAERAVEVKADEGKAFEDEQKTVELASDQKPLEEKVDKAESSPAPSPTKTEDVCPVIERKESEIAPEPADKIPKEEIPIHKEVEPEPKNETVSLPEKSEEKEKPKEEAESVAQKKEEQAVDIVLKADDKSEEAVVTSVPPTPDSKEPQVRDKSCEEELIQDKEEAGSQNANVIAENQHEVERETLALTDSDEKPLEKVTEQTVSVKEKEEKLNVKEVESQPVAGNIQELISVSETSKVCDKDGTAEFDVGKSAVSKTDEVSETENGGVSVSVAPVPVAEPEIPVCVVSEQDKGPKEGNTDVEEKKEAVAQPVGEPSGEDAAAEVTIVYSTSSGRLYNYIISFMSAIFKKCI